MITIQCDDCEKTFEVDSAEAGGKVPCPHCGDINRVPGSTEPQPPTASSRAAHVTTGDTDGSREKEITVIRPAMFRAHPFRYLLVMLLLLGGLTLTVCGLLSVVAAWLAVPGAIIALIGLVWLAVWWLNTHLWIKAIITNKRTIRHEGIVRRHTTEVLHDHVRSVDINQNFVQRIFNVGYIGIDSAGQEDIEIEIRDIPGPYKVKEIIDRYRKM